MILYFIFKLVLSFIFSLPNSVKTTLTEDDLDGRHINAGLVMFWVTALAGFFTCIHAYKGQNWHTSLHSPTLAYMLKKSRFVSLTKSIIVLDAGCPSTCYM